MITRNWLFFCNQNLKKRLQKIRSCPILKKHIKCVFYRTFFIRNLAHHSTRTFSMKTQMNKEKVFEGEVRASPEGRL